MTDTPYKAAPSTGRKGKRKRDGPDIITEVPLDEGELFHEVTITRHNRRIRTTSKPVCIPLPPTPQRTDPVLDTPRYDGDVYSDTEETQLLPATRNRERKSPSRSVSVRSVFFSRIYSCC